jgi:heme exporter protein B
MPVRHAFRAFRVLVIKDLVEELRARRAWPYMLLLGLILVLLVELQLDVPPVEKEHVVCVLLWLDIFFAGTLALDRSFASEREEDCWRTLRLYPLPPPVIFLAKLTVNLFALLLLESILIPAFVIFSNVPLLDRPLLLALVALLANLGFAAVGVLVSALTITLSHRNGLLALLVFPMMTPVLLAAAAATHLLMAPELAGKTWHWIHLLAAFSLMFTTLGLVTFEFTIED